ncbi:MAG: hypothetical protein PHH60_01060, partial [Candidatus Margulisbacteria bacterium]|nr:hypothetical protein [Candidatus Margulisiibacteriota bacterium]
IALSKRLLANILEKRNTLFEQLEAVRKQSEAKKEAEEKDAAELLALKEAYRKVELEIDEIMLKLDEEKDRLRDIELDRRFSESELQREVAALSDLEKRHTELEQKTAEIKRGLEAEVQGLELINSPLAGLLNETLQHSTRLVELLSSIFGFFGENRAFSLNLGRSAEKEETYKLKLEMLDEESKRVSGEKERLKFAAQAHRAQLDNLSQKIEQSTNKQTALDLLGQKRQAKDGLSQQIASLEDKLRNEGQNERKSLGEEASLEIALAKLEGEMGAIRDRLSLDYNLSVEELEGCTSEITNVPKAKKEIEEGKARLRALEPVNLLAIEEFEKEKERLSFVEAQLLDLNSARTHLQSLISELDLKAEQTFIETMQQLSTVFSETFSKLFVGGESRISLTPNVPALEAEIEISVRPSGRKWLPLPLLSGGERSLSAIAILFSLLKIRPSPFCFLDEVDAALDDANVGRFTAMLKDFSSESQILVITHSKRTMAIADNIYGVTMEEPGVSKVISMKLTEAVA